MPTVPVEIPGARYEVIVEPGILSRVGSILSKLATTKKAAIVTDSHVGPLHAGTLIESLKSTGIEWTIATIPAGEQHKTLSSLLPIYDQLLAGRIERSTPVLALGGGVVGDMAGFVAATVLRGVPFVQIPTTLLSMVDASVGGKTGVDTAAGKNLVGAFHQPIAVLADPLVLKTLPGQEIRNGLAECIKHEIIRDAGGFAELERNVGRALQLDVDYLTQLVAHNVAIKAGVVAADPFEKGERAHLNLGHTFGHAIESISHYTLSHGQSVGLGMVAAVYVAKQLNLLDEPSRGRIVALIKAAGLPVSGAKVDLDSVVDAMYSDKKVRGGKLRIVLPRGIGAAIVRDDVPQDLIRQAMQTVCM
jgi:3-dehydroquinate synthase